VTMHAAPSSALQRITLCGSFGYANAGDEAVPLALRDLADDAGWSLEFDIVSRFDDPALPEVIGLGEKDRARRDALCGQPMLFVGGGVIEPRDMSVFNRCLPLVEEMAAPSAGLFACAVEPGTTFPWMMRRRLRRALARLDLVTVRDVLSQQALRAIAPRLDVEVTGDVVLWMRPADMIPEPLRAFDRYIAVSLASKWLDESTFHDWLAGHLERLASELNAAIVFVPCASRFDKDAVQHQRVAKIIAARNANVRIAQINEQLGPREVAAVLDRAVLTIGMRLHAAVMAYANRTPFVALAYHPKLHGFVRTVKQEMMLLPGSPPSQQSRNTHGYAWNDLALTDCDLFKVALSAIDNADFSRIEPLKRHLRDTLQRTLQLPDPVSAASGSEVPA
jgi:polysaccharide pyruvyl transferase WcaK-like protein